MKKELEELRKKAILDIYSWGGLGPTPGVCGTIITEDKKLYTYHNYRYLSQYFKDKGIPESSLGYIKTLSEKEYNKIEKYITEKIINNKYKPLVIFDASFHIDGSYQGKKFKLTNIADEKGELLYFNLNKLISKIKGDLKNEEK